MKKLTLLAFMLFGLMITQQSCKDPCKDVECNNGTCVEGVCDCEANYYGDNCDVFCVNGTGSNSGCSCTEGWEGTNCDTEERAKFLGTYTVSDDCDVAQYNSTISSSSSDVTKVLISNFANVFTNSVTGTVDGTSISIAKQEPDNDDWFVEGNGTISGSTITMSYSVTEPDNTVTTCSTTWNKQ